MRTNYSRYSPVRRGFTMAEVVVAGVLIGTLLASAVPMLRSVARQQRAADRQQIAQIEAANIIDRMTSGPWNGITPESAAAVKLSDETLRQLPEATLKATVSTDPARPEEKRISLVLRWEEERGMPAAPVKLTTWIYQRGRLN